MPLTSNELLNGSSESECAFPTMPTFMVTETTPQTFSFNRPTMTTPSMGPVLKTRILKMRTWPTWMMPQLPNASESDTRETHKERIMRPTMPSSKRSSARTSCATPTYESKSDPSSTSSLDTTEAARVQY